MPIMSLYRYYEYLLSQGLIAGYGYEKKGMAYAVVLKEDGSVRDFICLRQPLQDERRKGKAFLPQDMVVPRSVVRSGNPNPNFLWDSASYTIYGIKYKKKDLDTELRWNSARTMYFRLWENNEYARKDMQEICNYYDKAHPELLSRIEADPAIAKDIENSNITFILSDGTYAVDNAVLRRLWEQTVAENEIKGNCCVTGEPDVPIARIHNKIMHIPGGLATGTSLVSFNIGAATTRGHDTDDKGENAPISAQVEFGYVSALNYLLTQPYHHQMWGEMEVVYWTERNECTEAAADAVDGNEGALNMLVRAVSKGKDATGTEAPLRFHIIGIKPNSGRLAIAFCQSNDLNVYVENIRKHYAAANVCKSDRDTRETVPPYAMLNSVANPANKNDTMPPKVVEMLWRAITEGRAYPQYLYNKALIRNIYEVKVTRDRASIIKAVLTRNYGRKDLTMALDENSTSKAYNLGRVFAILEKLQHDAIRNASSVTKCFSAACTTPSTCFPRLMLADRIDYYAAKAEYGTWMRKKIYEIMMRMEGSNPVYPKRFTSEESGMFQLGYYHQRQYFYTKKAASGVNSKDTAEVKESIATS